MPETFEPQSAVSATNPTPVRNRVILPDDVAPEGPREDVEDEQGFERVFKLTIKAVRARIEQRRKPAS